MTRPPEIPPARGRLGVLLPGMGAVATTFVAGVELHRRGLGPLYGSLTQMDRVRLGKRYEHRQPLIRDVLPLADTDDLVFGGWDLFGDSAWQTLEKAGVLPMPMLEPARDALEALQPMTAVHDRAWLRNLDGPHVKRGASRWDLAQQVMEDIERFKATHGLDRLVMIWCGSTEVHATPGPVHEDLTVFEKALETDGASIPPSMVYAYAALKLGIPYANGAPNLSADVPALVALADETGAPIAGKDFKTGQTLLKTVIAPGLRARLLGLRGWYSTNILGNRDGEVLDDPGSFKAKEATKMSVLDSILQPELHPELYGHYDHKVRIDYYPPRGDSKEGWDNIDIFGWLGMPMQIKVNFLCRDSVLAAPLVLDLALFLDLAKRAGLKGIQEWLSFYFKSPQCREDLRPEHSLFVQEMKLKNTLRILAGEEVLDHAGLDYYDPQRGARITPAPPRSMEDAHAGTSPPPEA